MNPAKIRLSPPELELVTDAELILTKNAILKKAKLLLEQLQADQQQLVSLHAAGLPDKVLGTSHKISRGENYQGLPYLILDFPRIFEHENLPGRQAGIFAVRTMFWWGNFFSVTLHLSGIYKKDGEEKIIASYEFLKDKGYYCYTNENQWEHHFEDDNYILVSGLNKNDFERSVRQNPFVKLANKIPLQQWDEAGEMLIRFFREIIEMLTVHPPRR